ncbi:hypothetical protein C0J52_18161 [Blattella germanica]|nr:hypothetical protein C0J52_18161 [Blattella germanica]
MTENMNGRLSGESLVQAMNNVDRNKASLTISHMQSTASIGKNSAGMLGRSCSVPTGEFGRPLPVRFLGDIVGADNTEGKGNPIRVLRLPWTDRDPKLIQSSCPLLEETLPFAPHPSILKLTKGAFGFLFSNDSMNKTFNPLFMWYSQKHSSQSSCSVVPTSRKKKRLYINELTGNT